MQTLTPPASLQRTTPRIALDTLLDLVTELATQHPDAGARIEHAAFILAFRRVERSGAGGWWVASERDPEQEYLVLANTCTCQDYHRRAQACKHQLAVELYQRAERLEAETADPTVDAEAPITLELPPAAWALLDPRRLEPPPPACSGCGALGIAGHPDHLCRACIAAELFGDPTPAA